MVCLDIQRCWRPWTDPPTKLVLDELREDVAFAHNPMADGETFSIAIGSALLLTHLGPPPERPGLEPAGGGRVDRHGLMAGLYRNRLGGIPPTATSAPAHWRTASGIWRRC